MAGGEGGKAGLRTNATLRPGGDLAGLYSAIVESSDDAVVGLSPDGTIVSWNPAAESLFGFSESEAVGRPVHITAGEEHRAELEDLLDRITRGEHVRHYETERFRKGGERVPVSITLSPIYGPDGGVVGASKITRDISERRRADDRLKEALAYAEGIVETVRMPLVVLDAGLSVRTANRAFYRKFGVTPDETVGRRVYDLGSRQWDTPDLRRLLEEILPRETTLEDYGVEHDFDRLGRRQMCLNARRLERGGEGAGLILLSIEDVTERRAAEARVRFQSHLLEAVGQAVIASDPAGEILFWNKAAEDLYGWSKGEAEGRNVADLVVAPEAATQAAEIMARLGSGEDWSGEFAVRRKDGTTFPAFVTDAPIMGEGGRLEAIVGVSADVTERRRTEAALTESEGRLRALTDNLPDGAIYRTVRQADGRNRFTFFSAGVERLFGISAERAVSDPAALYDTIHEDDWDRVRAAEAEAQRTQSRFDCEFRHRMPDGEVRWVHARSAPRRLPDGRVVWEGVLTDITGRRRAEERLRQSEERFRGLMDQAPFSVQILAADGRTIRVNSAWEELWGLTLDQLADYNVLDDPQLEAKGVAPGLRKAFAGEPAALPEIAYDTEETLPGRTRNEEPVRWISAVAYPIKDAAGIVREVALVHEDITARRRAEAALRESELRNRSIVESITDAFFALDRDWKFTYVNRRAAELLGRDDLVGKDIWSEFPEAPGSDFERHYRRAVEEGESASFEAYYPSHRRWYDVNAYPSADGLSVYFRDASERRWAAEERERLLAEAEAERNRLTAVVENVPVAVVLAEAPSGRIVLGNRHVERVFGHPFRPSPDVASYAEWVGYHPDGRRVEGHEWPLARALAGEVVSGEEFLYERGDGTRAWIRAGAAPVPDGTGAVAGAVVAADDIDAEKRAEAATRRLAGQFRSLAAASATINSSLSKESVLQVVTEEARHVIGAYQAVSSLTENDRWAQAINTVSLSDKYRDWRDYSAEPDGGGIYTLVCRTNTPMRLTQEELVSHPAWKNFGGDDDHPPMRGWLAAPLVGRDGRNLGLIQLSDKDDGSDFTVEDEAILVQLAQTASVALENARLYDALRDADRRKDEFLAMLAHELRNPLAPIRSGLDLLRMEGSDSEAVEVMSEQVGHVVRLVDDLLDVSRILRGKVELKKEPTDLSAVLRRAAETVRPRTEEHGQRLSVSIPAEPIRLDADPVRLTQVVSNLLNNASKYTDDGGEVRLGAELSGAEVVIRVSDTGIGIEPKLLPRVFDLFTQADQALDRSQGGLGIGLTVVRSLAEMHGGSVEAASGGVGRGATFTVRLPVNVPAEAGAADVPADAPAGSRRVLLVDDNAPAAKLLGRLLEKLGGHEIRIAHDGPSALVTAADFRPDLVLLDIGLPRMDGYEVARRLRERPEFRDTLLVALTGYGTEEDRRRSIEAGFDDHVTKPPGVDLLRKVLSHPKLRRP